MLLIVPATIVIIIVGFAVLIYDGRLVILMQPRAGQYGRVFSMPKIRTMRISANDDQNQITQLGRLLRPHRLDELPQLFSVLAGRMSLVGPRPELIDIVEEYQPCHKRRLVAKPGITGLWQLLGSRRQKIHEQIGYDLYYLRKASLCLDVKIMAATIPFVLRPGAWQV